jgi:tellurite resistance protein TerA
MGVVQALGEAFTSQNAGRPIISLDGDDRSGASTSGQNLRIDLSRAGEIARVLVFAYIYDGVPNWAAADGVVTLYPASGAPVAISLDEPDHKARFCAIALLAHTGGELSVHREVAYLRGGHQELDRAYGWGLSWRPGRK